MNMQVIFSMSDAKRNDGEKSTKKEENAPKQLKPCCACPETKRVRDECIMENGEEHCANFIEAHKKCMRDLGFNI